MLQDVDVDAESRQEAGKWKSIWTLITDDGAGQEIQEVEVDPQMKAWSIRTAAKANIIGQQAEREELILMQTMVGFNSRTQVWGLAVKN